MKIFKIPDSVAVAKYRGTGYALAAHDDRSVIDLVYLREAIAGFDDPSAEDGDDVDSVLQAAIRDHSLRPAIEQLRAQGDVSIGLCSAHEFIQL